MKVLVIGTWHPKISKEYSLQAEELGLLLAKRNHILVSAPSTGFQGLAARSYKKNKGKQFIGYYPDLKIMKKVGEKVLVEPDKKIFTKQDYPTRNLMQVKICDCIIAITGGVGTLTELSIAAKDYNLPTAYYSGSSEIVDSCLKLDNKLKAKIKTGKNILLLIKYLEEKTRK